MPALLQHLQTNPESGGQGAPAPTLADAKEIAAHLGLNVAQMSSYWSHRVLSNKAEVLAQDCADSVFNCALAVAKCLQMKLPPSWLTQPTALLRNRVPLALLQTSHGAAFVLVAVERASR